MNQFVGMRFHFGYLILHKGCSLVHKVHYRGIGKVQYMGYMLVHHTDSVTGSQVYRLLKIGC